ncbi:MAG: bifunctional D-glycero-beta-D-manno-heptose-7-phosphate kinase/D-glycero-beta-D-manno-heptose 1-phosphate adenylyltransferase HldE [Gammaproteobacteria bacterium]
MLSTYLPFESSRILVVGDIILDRYWSGPTERVSPEAPVPVVRIEKIEERPGGAGNVALNIASLGANASLMGLTGKDEASGTLEHALGQSGVNCYFSQLSDYPTITKLRVLSQHQQLIRLDFESTSLKFDQKKLIKKYRQLLEKVDVVILSDYAKGCLTNVEELIEIASKVDKKVIVDPKGNDFQKYKNATLITPNFGEFTAVVGECQDVEEIVTKGNVLCKNLNLEALLVTRGEHGMTLIQPAEEPAHFPARAAEVFDVTGAGDTVIATLATALAAGGTFSHATALANTAAGLVVAKLGTASVTLEELHTALHEPRKEDTGTIDEEQMVDQMQAARLRGETIVMTNGCFDILHAGHISYLEKARSLGDRLIIAVNDDASVQRLKGESRPLNNLNDRMKVLEALSCVDWVVPFSEDTPERLISNLLPDILVKGGDYKPEEIAGGKQVSENGGKVIVLDFLDGYSTTKLIETAQKNQGEDK